MYEASSERTTTISEPDTCDIRFSNQREVAYVFLACSFLGAVVVVLVPAMSVIVLS